MIGSLIAIAALVLINGFFVAAEFALISAREARLGEGRLANLVLGQRAKLDEYLSACQVGITIASLALGALGEPTIAHLVEPYLEGWLAHGAAVGTLGTIIALFIMTGMHITAGEQAPKSLAIGSAERVAKFCAVPLHVFYTILRPAVLMLNAISNGMVRLVGGTPASGHGGGATMEELRHMIGSVTVSEHLDRTEQQMLTGLFTLDERCAADIMTARHNVRSLTPDMSVHQALMDTRESGHSRFPVVDDEGRVTGIITARALVNELLEGRAEQSIGELATEILIAPRSQPLDTLLGRMKSERSSLCAIIDEYGQLDGVVAVEDIIEEVVGEIWDEDDLPRTIEGDGNGGFTAPGDTSVHDLLSEGIDVVEQAGEFDSIGGLVQNVLGDMPGEGTVVAAGEWQVEVTAVDGHRVESVHITPTEVEDESPDEAV